MKILGPVTKNKYLKIIQRGGPFASAGGRIPERGGACDSKGRGVSLRGEGRVTSCDSKIYHLFALKTHLMC